MATAEKTEDTSMKEQSNGNGGGNAGSTAIKAAAAAAATGLAAFAVTKAISGHHGSDGQESGGDRKSSSNGGGGGSSPASLMGAIASGSFGAVQDALVPLAEEAAGAAGTFLATSGPDIVRETIVPRFIDSFNEARSGGDGE
jgi:hypothetical protein